MMSARVVVSTAVATGLVLRLAFALGYWTGKPLTHDELEYLALGANLAAGRGSTADWPGEQPHPLVDRFGRAPLYPAFLAPLVSLDPEVRAGRRPTAVPVAVKVAQCALGALGVWLMALIARRAAGERAAAIAATIAAVYPPLVWVSAYALSEAFYVPLALALVLALGRVTDRDAPLNQDWPWAAVAGAVCGLAILARPATLFVLPLAVAWLAWRRRAFPAVALLAAAVVVVAPWTIRNARTYGRFVLVASEGGVTFWTGNHPQAMGEGDLAANPRLKQANQAFKARHPGLTPEQLEPLYYREALAWMKSAPLDAGWLVVRKAFFTVVPVGPSYRLHSSLYFWGSVLPYAAVLPFGIAGALALRRRPAPPRALWLLAGSALLVCLVFFPQERFRIPVIDPTIIVCAAAWFALRREAGAATAAS